MDFEIGHWNAASTRETYFIADIGANHDGDLGRAKELIALAAEAGADAAKFQNFTAEDIVSDKGFRALGGQLSHQGAWQQSVFEVYDDASLPYEWTAELAAACDAADIDYFSSPYDLDAVAHLDPYVEVYKAGSGVLTWHELLAAMAATGKPVILSCGASTLGETIEAVEVVRSAGVPVALLQCNTNYTGSPDNFDHLNLRTIPMLGQLLPDVVLGLSDHTGGSSAAVASVALGARIIEKHFTDDTTRSGPDHPFAMDPVTWREMVDRCREVEAALGDGCKRVEENEQETRVIQRPCLRARNDLPAGHTLTREDLAVLRPADPGAVTPDRLPDVLGMVLARPLAAEDPITWGALVSSEAAAATG